MQISYTKLFSLLLLTISFIAQPISAKTEVEKNCGSCPPKKCSLEQLCKIDKKILRIVEQFDCVTVIDKLPYEITKPGHYKVPCDLTFNPKPSYFAPPDPRAVQAAITITSSDVFLDLGDSTIRQFVPTDPSDQVPYCVGILIPDVIPTSTDTSALAPGGLQSIYISGDQAVISDFSMYGIRVFAHTYDVQISNLTVKNTGALASNALRPFPSYLPHSVKDYAPWASNAMQVGGIVIGETDFNGMGPIFFTDGTVTPIPLNRAASVILQNVSSLNNFYLGLFISFTSDVTIDNCHFDDTWSDQGFVPELGYAETPSGAFFLGSFITSGFGNGVINMAVRNTTFNNTQMRGDFTTELGFGYTAGMQYYDTLNTVYENCQFNNTSCTFPTAFFFNFTANCIGGGSVNATYNNCSFDNAQGIGGVMGFHQSGSGPTKGGRNTRLTNCTARNIQQIGQLILPEPFPVPGNLVTGFIVDFANNTVLENCVASDIIYNGPMENDGTVLAGFCIQDVEVSEAFVENTIFRGCIAQRIVAQNGGPACGFEALNGFFIPDPFVVNRSLTFENCIAENVSATGAPLWSSTYIYMFGDIVTFGGGLFSSLQNNNVGNTPPAPGTSDMFWRAQTVLGDPGIGCGFYLEGDAPNTLSFPYTLVGCQALHNKGIDTTMDEGVQQYSAGFYLLFAQRAALYQCSAVDNIYGFLLQNSDRCTIRECRADNNVDLLTLVGEGFTDLALNTLIPTPAPWSNVTVYSIGDLVSSAGINYQSLVNANLGNPPATSPNFWAIVGSPMAPGVTTSAFENNRAFNNGVGVFTGTNGNYNINVGAGVTPPILESQPSTATFTPINPATYFANLHNISSLP